HRLRKAVQADDRHLRGVCAVDAATEQRVREDAVVGGPEAELEDAVVRDGQRAGEGEPAGPAMRRVDPGRLSPRQLAEDPGRAEELEAGKHGGGGREPRLEMHRVAEEE